MTLVRSTLVPTLLLLLASSVCAVRTIRKWRPSEQRTTLTDFRFSSARIDGITRLFNDSLIVISNGHYWVLNKGELPRLRNVRGPTSDLYSGFSPQAIWTDPYNDVGEQIFLASNTPAHGLRVVCQEFSEPFSSDSSFCHLPVDASWKNALKDLAPDRPIDAVTWRNRTKDKDGGFWVIFQEHKMITVDPYEKRLRFTYDIRKWMGINETVTAAFYDYRNHVYHLFHENNTYRKWTVNVTFMNSLPMSWDRAFLHGTLSRPLKINRNFFGFSERDVRNWPQPYYEKIAIVDEISDNRLDNKDTGPRNSETPGLSRTSTSTEDSVSDVLYITPKEQIVTNQLRNGKLQTEDKISPSESDANSVENDGQISYQKQLMQFHQDGVLDFVSDGAINAAINWPAHTWQYVLMVWLVNTLLQRLVIF